jgi:hypothetical protein
MLERSGIAMKAGSAETERASRTTPTHRAMLERRRGNRLLAAWKAARTDLTFPSLAALEAAADPELMHHSMLVRVGAKGTLTIERFGPPAPQPAERSGRKDEPRMPVITPLVVTWVLAVSSAALRRRAPVTESDEVKVGTRHLCYRCAVVPVSSDGAEVDGLVGVLGYRWS